MRLTFNRVRVETLLAYSKAAGKWKSLYGQPETAKAGLWLVGDQGVYFMSNAEACLMADGKPRDEKTSDDASAYVCYARECNPEHCAFDEWWENKRMSFGGDDGCDFLPAEEVDVWLARTKGSFLSMELTPKSRKFELDPIPTMTAAPRLPAKSKSKSKLQSEQPQRAKTSLDRG